MKTNPVRKLSNGVVLVELRPGLETIVNTRHGFEYQIGAQIKTNYDRTRPDRDVRDIESSPYSDPCGN